MTTAMEYQDGYNGPLKKEIRDFLIDTKNKYRWTFKYMGKFLGISEAFAHNLIVKGGNVSTDTYYKSVSQGIDRLKGGETQLLISEGGERPRLLDHPYHLRSDLQVTLKLPADLTEREGERLSLFIQSLAQ